MEKTTLTFSRVSPFMLEPYKDKYDIIMSPEIGDIDAQFEAAIPNAHGLISVRSLKLTSSLRKGRGITIRK